MNRNRALLGIPIFRPQLFFAAGISLVVFLAALLCVNLIFSAMLSSHFWLSLGLAILVLGASAVIVKSGFFAKVSPKRGVIFISLLISVTAILMAHLFFISGIQSLLNFASFKHDAGDASQRGGAVKVLSLPGFIPLGWDRAHSRTLLIFDETDELDEGGHVRSQQWWQRVQEKDSGLAACDWASMKISAHFYRVTFFCDNPYSGPQAR